MDKLYPDSGRQGGVRLQANERGSRGQRYGLDLHLLGQAPGSLGGVDERRSQAGNPRKDVERQVTLGVHIIVGYTMSA